MTTLPEFVKARIDSQLRCSTLNKDSSEFQVRFVIKSRAVTNDHIKAAMKYLANS